ncbi:MAG: hypothetical protein GX209_01390 [Epulopiscium sp.]|mgnify:CR=1 FL=1|nr:hypothetical protein [Candidatus Epulonipiscium sp.]
MEDSSSHKFTYAYFAQDAGEICTVEVSLSVGNDKMRVFITPNEGQKINNDLPEILKQIEKNQLSRINLNILDDCEVYILEDEASNTYKKVEFIDENFTIKE